LITNALALRRLPLEVERREVKLVGPLDRGEEIAKSWIARPVESKIVMSSVD
jgi:hypothetical protein